VTVAERLAEVRDRIDAAVRASGRAVGAVRLVAVSKEHPVDAIRAALAAGQRDFGENRAQDLVAKAEALAGDPAGAPVWHFVGRLQRNKVRALAPHVARWHSIDRAALGPELVRAATTAPLLVQVNVAGETQKGGCDPADTAAIVDDLRGAGLVVDGLMTVPPAAVDPRPYFARLRDIGERLTLPELSMGMTGDFEAAIAEGATIVRVGSAIFGSRVPAARDR
jgi:pyridoxal phosphate enzyme (YggS family)